VVRDIAAAIGMMECYSGTPEHFFTRQQIFHVPVAAQRDRVRVLYQEKLIWNLAAFPLIDERALQIECFGVVNATDVAPGTTTHGRILGTTAPSEAVKKSPVQPLVHTRGSVIA